jgi:putative addiction module antidote
MRVFGPAHQELVDDRSALRYTICMTRGKSMNERARTTGAEGDVLQIKKIGNPTGVVLPKELLARLKFAEGDRLYVVEQTECGMKLSPYDPKHAKATELDPRSFRRYADTYQALAR